MIQGINDEKAIQFETAMEILNSMIALKLAQSAEVSAQRLPDLTRIASLVEERQKLVLERRQLDPNDTAAIARILKDYGSIVKERHGFTREA